MIAWIPVGLTPLIFIKLLKKLAGNDWVCAEREWFLRLPRRPKTNGGAGIWIDSNTTRVVLSSFTLRHSGARLKGVGDNHTPDPDIFQFNSTYRKNKNHFQEQGGVLVTWNRRSANSVSVRSYSR